MRLARVTPIATAWRFPALCAELRQGLALGCEAGEHALFSPGGLRVQRDGLHAVIRWKEAALFEYRVTSVIQAVFDDRRRRLQYSASGVYGEGKCVVIGMSAFIRRREHDVRAEFS